MSQTVQIARSEITRGRIVAETPPPLGDGEVRLRIESFSVTANNVTYAVAAIREHGPKAFGQAVAASWGKFLGEAGDSVRIDERAGLEAALDAFVATAEGRADPAVGIVIRP